MLAQSTLITEENFTAQKPWSTKLLRDLTPGQAGLIVAVSATSKESLQELRELGVSVHSIVRMLDNYAHYAIFKIGQREFAADEEITAGISVIVMS